MLVEVALDRLHGRVAQRLTQRGVRVRGVQMPIDEILGRVVPDDVAGERALVHLRQRVVQPLPVAERFVQRRVEAVEEAQLELVRALEQVLQLRERERDLRRLVAGLGLEPRRVGRHASVPGREPLLARAVVEEVRALPVELVRAGRERHEQVLLRAGDRDVEEPRLVLDRAAVAVGIGDRGVRDDVEEAEPAVPLRREAVLAQARNEHRRPLHPLGLVHGRERDRVGRRVPDVGVRLRVVVGSLVLEPLRERLVLLPQARC